MHNKINYLEVAIGILLLLFTVLNIIPGDEYIGVPAGIALILHGFKVRI